MKHFWRAGFLRLRIIALSAAIAVAGYGSAFSQDDLDPDEPEIEFEESIGVDSESIDDEDAEIEFEEDWDSGEVSIDDEETEIDMEASAETLDTDESVDSLDFEDPEIDMEDVAEENLASSEPERMLWEPFVDESHFTARHALAYRMEEPQEAVANRSSLRVQWERLVASKHFFRFDGKVAYDFVYDTHDYPNITGRRYRFVDNVREFYWQWNAGSTSFKVGKQIVVWGKADGAEVTDVISPRDLTEAVFGPVEDSRIGQVMLTVDHYADSGQWTLVFNPDPQTNEIARPGHPYALPRLKDQPGIRVKSEEQPDFSLLDMEVGARWAQTFGPNDFALMAAHLIEDTPVFKSKGFAGAPPELTLDPEFPRFNMVGGGANFSQGNFLWKAEIAVKFPRRFNRIDLLKSDGLIERNVFDLAAGFDYDANGAYTVSVELSNQRVVDWTDEISGIRRDESAVYASWSKSFLHDTLDAQYIVFFQIQDEEALHRTEVTYDITDHWSTTVDFAWFDAHDPNTFFGLLRDESRLSAELEYNF